MKSNMNGKEYYQMRKEKALEEAQEWQQEILANTNMSYSEMYDWGKYFHSLGSRFGLLREFKENGIPC